MIDHTLRVLILEDNKDDALFVERELEKTGFLFESTRVDKLADFRIEVSKLPDLVLADYSLPSFTALDALAVMKELQLSLPFVLISGKITEKTAVRCIKAGASDYVNKDHLETLPGAVHQALAEHAFTEEKLQMERALAEREAKYRMLFEDSSEGVVVTDLEGKIVDCNLAFEQLLGYRRDEILGEQIIKFFQDEGKQRMINQLLDEQGMVKNFELIFYTKEAAQIFGLITVSYLNDDSGNPELLLGLVRDISDRIKSQKEMETIVAINNAMRTALDNESLIPITLDLVMEISGAQGVALELVRQTSGKMELTATIGRLDSLSPGDINLGEDELAQLLKRGLPKIWQIGEEREFLEKAASTGLQMMVCVPLVSTEIDIGLIWMGCDNDLSLENLDLIQILANITANTIHRFNLNENNLRALEESRAVARIGRTLNEHLDLEKVFALIVEEAVGLVSGAYRAVIHVFDEKNERLHAVGFSEKKKDQIIAKNLLNIRVNPRNEFDFGLLSEADIEAASMVSGRGVAGLVIAEGQTINVANTEEDSRYLKTNGMSTASSLVVAPIISLDRPLGTLSVLSKSRNAFDSSVELLLENLCVQAATAIENARLLEAERQAREVAEAQTEISTLLNKSLELDVVLDMILNYAVRLFSATAANIMLLGEGQPRVYRHVGYEFLGEQAEDYTQTLADFIHQRMQEEGHGFGESLVIPETEKDANWKSSPAQQWVRSFASIPLVVGTETVGLLNIDSKKPHTFGEKELQLFQVFANNAASAIKNSWLYADLEKSLLTEQATRTRLIRADKLAGMGRMVASVAHELNNPLQTIKNCLFLIEQSTIDEESAEVLDLGMSEVERLTGIVNRLRDVYRPALTKEYQLTQISPLLKDLELMLETHLRRSKVELVIEKSKFGDVYVNGFVDRLKQVLLNLSLNGIEAMQPDGGKLLIRLLKEKTRIGIAFIDTGFGINPMDMDLIFDPFYTTKDTGMGLGLSICYDIVQDHSGSITVENNEEAGATFTVWLPLSDEKQK